LRAGRKWVYWAFVRALWSGYAKAIEINQARKKIRELPDPQKDVIFSQTIPKISINKKASVSVLIPTLDRYNYIRKLLPQLENQTIPPMEIIIVDQTSPERRASNLQEEFPNLPLKVLFRDRPGQCSARNQGIQISRGDYILFLDDDDEVPADLIESHLRCLEHFHAPASCGVADEVGAGELPYPFTYIRCSDVFPTNNTLIDRSILESSGLFDVAHDGGERDDADLGTRVYLNGHLMILNPTVRILHHHASSGGLRSHRARVVTYAKSRKSLFYRHLPSVSQLYLNKKFFTHRQTREAILLSLFGTFSFHGNLFGKVIKLLLGFLLLPHSLWRISQNNRRAGQLLKQHPPFQSFSQQNTPRNEPVNSLP
jgi:glycosyltransferase involved in cell wall biosynthesis